MSLPHLPLDADFDRVDKDLDYGPAIELIRLEADLPLATPLRYEDGSLPVFAIGDHVIKLYPACSRRSFDNEPRVLRCVAGELGVPTPQVLRTGEVDGWGYVVMTRLVGKPLRGVWSSMTADDRVSMARHAGELVASLHRVDPEELPRHDWDDFVKEQRVNCVQRHTQRRLPEAWLSQLEPYLSRWGPCLRTAEPHVILHTEIMQEHLLVEERDGRFELSGLLDFEPARVGPAEYELASVGVFFSEGDRDVFEAFLAGLGVDRDPELSNRCMAWALLHRYAHLGWWLDRLPPRSPRRSIDDLAVEWF